MPAAKTSVTASSITRCESNGARGCEAEFYIGECRIYCDGKIWIAEVPATEECVGAICGWEDLAEVVKDYAPNGGPA